jgi:gamma-glutamyltranspeptidase / glutathione hydrolase
MLADRGFKILFFAVVFSITVSSIFSQPRDLESVTGTNGMVSTAHPLASQTALTILKNGGNAVDAAVGAAFSIGVVEPDGSGIGGGGSMMIYLNDEKKVYYINFYQKASMEVDKLDYKRREDGISAKTALVPGNVAGLTEALEEFGSMNLEDVLDDAIKYAEDGFPVDNTLSGVLLDNIEILQKYPATSKIFLPGGFPLMEGDILKQPELASTLKIIKEDGDEGFYEGEIAEKIVAGITSEGGVITLDDLEDYEPEILEPLVGDYRGYKIYSANAPQSGASIIQSLNMMENIDFKKYGHFTESTATLHLMAETFLRSYADRYYFVGDPNFAELPLDIITSQEYADQRFAEINFDYTLKEGYRKTPAGNPYGVKENQTVNELEELGHTTHISIVDKNGNMVSLTQTLGTFFGCGYSVEGIIFNSSLINFSSKGDVNQLEPGKTPRSTISPTIIVKDDKPFAAIGTPGGGRIVASLTEIIVNVIDFEMSAESANQAPRFYCQVNDDYLNMENRISEKVRNELEEKGHQLKVYGEFDLYFGGAQFIIVNWDKHKFYGTADKRRGGVALGY